MSEKISWGVFFFAEVTQGILYKNILKKNTAH